MLDMINLMEASGTLIHNKGLRSPSLRTLKVASVLGKSTSLTDYPRTLEAFRVISLYNNVNQFK